MKQAEVLDPRFILQVDRGADDEIIKAAYRRLIQKYHPDKNPDNHTKCANYVNSSHAVRSGSFLSGDKDIRSAFRFLGKVSESNKVRGFRLAHD